MPTGDTSPRQANPSSDEFQALLAQYLQRAERDGTVALEDFQRKHPKFAHKLGKQLAWLADHLARHHADLPERVGPYRVLQRLGVGGMGEVFLAEQTTPFQRAVAVKVIRTDTVSEGRVGRFANEIQALAAVNHDGIAKLFEAGEAGGQPWFAM